MDVLNHMPADHHVKMGADVAGSHIPLVKANLAARGPRRAYIGGVVAQAVRAGPFTKKAEKIALSAAHFQYPSIYFPVARTKIIGQRVQVVLKGGGE